jgi:hypothetical protein
VLTFIILLPHETNKSREILLEPGQTGQSDFVGIDASQGRCRASTREPLLQPSDIWSVKELEQRRSKELRRQILDLNEVKMRRKEN